MGDAAAASQHGRLCLPPKDEAGACTHCQWVTQVVACRVWRTVLAFPEVSLSGLGYQGAAD